MDIIMLCGLIIAIVLSIKKVKLFIAVLIFWILEIVRSRFYLFENEVYNSVTLLLSVVVLCFAMILFAVKNKEHKND